MNPIDEYLETNLDPQPVLDRILEQMGRLLSIQMFSIIALDEEKGSQPAWWEATEWARPPCCAQSWG